ncbi:cathepsin O-like [Battus philenor]|uniref:cathepsin O-like n=1 Tax=Battus philenor TaxID=42288 RepID=UPI0035CEB1D4
MKKWWNWILGIALFCLLFIAIPLSFTGESREKLKPMFDDYIEKFNKTYKDNPEEYETRFRYFVASVREIELLNSEARGPEQHRARYGLTKLSDMSKSEYRDIHLSDERPQRRKTMQTKTYNKKKNHTINVIDYDDKKIDDENDKEISGSPHDNIYIIIRKRRATMPLKVDWRTKGVVGPVKDQGLCGACWAFSTVGVMESMAAISTGQLQSLSVQEAIDCAGLGNNGCEGGDICLLLDWLMITNTPVQPEKDYPLKLKDGKCKSNSSSTGVRVDSFTCDNYVDAEDKILEAIANHGPVTVAVNALTWQNYLGGVIQYHCSGEPRDLNHAVQLVGYDLSADVPHYIVKNSWGKEFGNDGYLKLAIGSNVCGLANEMATVSVK